MTIAIHEEGSKDFNADISDTWDVIQTITGSPSTTDGVFQFGIDTHLLAAGDTLEARLQVKDAAAGTLRTVWQCSWTGAQSVTQKQITTALVNSWDFSMRQRAGTGRVILWSIVKVT